MNIKEMLVEFLNFRHEVVFKRLTFDLDKAEKRAHILEGLKIALDNIEEIIALIRKSRSVETARANLMKQFKLSEIQAQAILDMRLQRLTGLERKKIEDEYLEIIKLIEKIAFVVGQQVAPPAVDQGRAAGTQSQVRRYSTNPNHLRRTKKEPARNTQRGRGAGVDQPQADDPALCRTRARTSERSA
jgi:hypothetical protein